MSHSRELAIANLIVYVSLLANERQTLRALIDSEITDPEYKLQARTRVLEIIEHAASASSEIARLEAAQAIC